MSDQQLPEVIQLPQVGGINRFVYEELLRYRRKMENIINCSDFLNDTCTIFNSDWENLRHNNMDVLYTFSGSAKELNEMAGKLTSLFANNPAPYLFSQHSIKWSTWRFGICVRAIITPAEEHKERLIEAIGDLVDWTDNCFTMHVGTPKTVTLCSEEARAAFEDGSGLY